MSYRFADRLRAGAGRHSALLLLANFVTYIIAVCTVKIPDDVQRNCPKHVKFYSVNKFEKLVHLVGFIIRMLPLSFGCGLHQNHFILHPEIIQTFFLKCANFLCTFFE